MCGWIPTSYALRRAAARVRVPKKTQRKRRKNSSNEIPPGTAIYGEVTAAVSLELTRELPDKPPLGDYAYERIEGELHEVDKTYWDQLSIFQVPTTSVVTSKAAICGHFKTGHMDWPET